MLSEKFKGRPKRPVKPVSGIIEMLHNSSCAGSLGIDDNWWWRNLALSDFLESRVRLILLVVILHVVQAGENSHGDQVVSLAARVLDGLGGRTLDDVGLSIL